MALADAREITTVSAATLADKLLQYANGAIYDQDKQAHVIHDKKIEALREILDTAAGDLFSSFIPFGMT